MIESHDPYDSVQEIEALIRAAGDYVQPSEELRPRVMEAVRSQRVERTVQWRICQAAVLFLALNFLGASTLRNVELADGSPPPVQRAHPGPTVGSGDQNHQDWDTVDAFRELRRRQAYLLRLHL